MTLFQTLLRCTSSFILIFFAVVLLNISDNRHQVLNASDIELLFTAVLLIAYFILAISLWVLPRFLRRYTDRRRQIFCALSAAVLASALVITREDWTSITARHSYGDGTVFKVERHLSWNGLWIRHGQYRVYFPGGQVSNEFHYSYGKKDGVQRSWYPNGNLQSIQTYMDGRQFGRYAYYNPDGSEKLGGWLWEGTTSPPPRPH